MTVYKLNPLQDPRWDDFVQAHPKASVFHTVNWLGTLHATYGYEPLAFTTSDPGSVLRNGVVFCRVSSWITGTRLVSIPFADHCQPLYESPEELYAILDWIAADSKKNGRGRVEVRPVENDGLAENTELKADRKYRLHLLDLAPTLQDILRACDKSSVQRRLRHAEREHLVFEEGNSPQLLKKFYHLLVITRRRHGVPPQPLKWFSNMLVKCGDKAKVRVVSHEDTPIASVLTLSHNGSMIYKYGCSDVRHHNLAGMVSLFWRSIQDAKERGMRTFDMGRSDLDNPGLLRFKSNWGTQDLPLTYWRYPRPTYAGLDRWARERALGENLLSRLPNSLLIAVGNALYKHAG